MNRLLVACALVIPACIPVAACTPAQLQKFESARAVVEAECVAAKADYEAIAQGRDDACAVINLLPGEVAGIQTEKAKLACSHSARVESAAQRVVRVCAAIGALGAP